MYPVEITYRFVQQQLIKLQIEIITYVQIQFELIASYCNEISPNNHVYLLSSYRFV